LQIIFIYSRSPLSRLYLSSLSCSEKGRSPTRTKFERHYVAMPHLNKAELQQGLNSPEHQVFVQQLQSSPQD
jgi:hypothetical protein